MAFFRVPLWFSYGGVVARTVDGVVALLACAQGVVYIHDYAGAADLAKRATRVAQELEAEVVATLNARSAITAHLTRAMSARDDGSSRATFSDLASAPRTMHTAAIAEQLLLTRSQIYACFRCWLQMRFPKVSTRIEYFADHSIPPRTLCFVPQLTLACISNFGRRC